MNGYEEADAGILGESADGLKSFSLHDRFFYVRFLFLQKFRFLIRRSELEITVIMRTG